MGVGIEGTVRGDGGTAVSGKKVQPVGSLRGPNQRFDKNGNPTDLATFYKTYPSFIWGPLVLASATCAACSLSTSMAEKLKDGRAVQYGLWDTLTYTIFAILATFATHGWFCVHAAQERQLQEYERREYDADGKRRPTPAAGEPFMNYSDRSAPRGASVRSTAALLTSWVYAFYPFGAPSDSWLTFAAWTCALAVYWDLHFFIAHKLAHENATLYKFFHKLHHFYTAPDVFGAYYVTYQSHFMTEQSVLLLAAFAGLPRDVFTWTMFLGTFDTCIKHSGHDVGSVQRGLPISWEGLMTILNPWSLVLGGGKAQEHDWHHEKFTKNYALSFTYLDKLFGSYHVGRTPGDAVGLSRKKKEEHTKQLLAAREADEAEARAAAKQLKQVEATPSMLTALNDDASPPSPPPSPPSSPPASPPPSAPSSPRSPPVAPEGTRKPSKPAAAALPAKLAATPATAKPTPRSTLGVVALLLPLILAYGAMVLAQTKGPEIVGLLHGDSAQAEASKPPEDVAPGTPLLEYASRTT